MVKVHTKEAAESLLRELPSVLGTFVREDVNGHPREVHLLISPGPNVKLLAQDVRDLLEERLGVPIDHRIISIAQLAEDIVDSGADAGLADLTDGSPPERRLRFTNISCELRDQRVHVNVQLETQEQAFLGEATELDLGNGRCRAGAAAALRAAAAALPPDVRLELETASLVRALDREYVLVSVLAGTRSLGRSLLPLCGAQPVETDAETAAALATLKAINRVVAKLLSA